MNLPPLIRRLALQASLGVSSETMRTMLKAKRLPPLDVHVSHTVQGWYPDTLRAAGIKVPEIQPAAPQREAA